MMRLFLESRAMCHMTSSVTRLLDTVYAGSSMWGNMIEGWKISFAFDGRAVRPHKERENDKDCHASMA